MIELVAGTADSAAAARIMTTVRRWIVIEPESLEHARATTPAFEDWIALLDGKPVGAGSCSLNLGMEDDTAAFGVACVLPETRGKGVGTALYREVSAHARRLGKSELVTWGYEDDAGGVAFAERHGFVIVRRIPALRLVLDGCPRPTVDLPEDIAITTLADSPELARGVWETATEAMPDIPTTAFQWTRAPSRSSQRAPLPVRGTSPRRRSSLSGMARSSGMRSSPG